MHHDSTSEHKLNLCTTTPELKHVRALTKPLYHHTFGSQNAERLASKGLFVFVRELAMQQKHLPAGTKV
jgi:hypothetical protein